MASHRINFTKAVLERIKPPVKKQDKKGGVFDTYYDTREKGLILLVSNGGSKSFYLYSKVNGKPERVKLGSFPDMTIERARKAAVNNRSLVNAGKNPNAEKKKLKAEMTFKELFDKFMERYSKKYKSTWQNDEREVNKYLFHWFDRRISSITKQEIQKLHEKIGSGSGIYQSNRLLERIRAIYNKGIEWGLDIPNPTQGIKKFREQSRERFLQADELPHFWQSLAEEENETARDYIILSVLTGARKGNVLSMRWEEINFDRAEWRIPLTKNGEPLTVALSPQAIEILRSREEVIDSQWVFPSEFSSSGHLADPKKAWSRVLRKTTIAIWEKNKKIAAIIEQVKSELIEGYTSLQLFNAIKEEADKRGVSLPIGVMDVRLHDLRRTLGSWQAATGATTALIGKSLGHKSQKATAIYERLSIDPVRESVERATEAMFATVGKKAS